MNEIQIVSIILLAEVASLAVLGVLFLVVFPIQDWLRNRRRQRYIDWMKSLQK